MRTNQPVTNKEVVLEDGQLIVSRTDAGGRITFVNQTFCDVSGFDASELVGQPHNIVRHPDMPAEAFADLWSYIKRGLTWQGFVKNRAKNGDHYWVKANVSPIVEGGKVTGYISVRSKPQPSEVEKSEAAYRQIASGRAAGLKIEDGRVVSNSFLANLRSRFRNLHTQFNTAIGLVVAALVLSLVMGNWALSRVGAALDQSSAAAAKVSSQALPLVAVVKDIKFDVVQIQQWLTDVSATQAKDGLGDGFELAAGFRTQLTKDIARARELSTALGLVKVGEILDQIERDAKPYHDVGVEMAKAYVAGGPAAGNPLMGKFDVQSQTVQDTVAKLSSLIDEFVKAEAGSIAREATLADEVQSGFERLFYLPLVLGLLAGIGSYLIVRGVAGQIGRLSAYTSRAAAGAQEDDIPGMERRDEIGALAKSIQAFRFRIQYAELERVETEARAKAQQASALMAMAEHVERDTEAAVGNVSDIVNKLKQSSSRMNVSVSDVNVRAQAVAEASVAARSNVQTVAAAAEELSASIREISTQVHKTAEVSKEAVSMSRGATAAIAELNSVVQKISEFAGIIQDVANQTNLLALNATIEAARAGDAGKGFAVVASEVKNLAAQTSKSTEEISRTVDMVLRATQSAASAVGEIGHKINQVDSFASGIAAAIEEQASATTEISRSISEATRSTEVVETEIGAVSGQATGAQRQTEEVSGLSVEIDKVVADLQLAVVRSIHAVTDDVDRRSDDRLEVPVAVRLLSEDGTHEGKIRNLSLGGALIETRADFGGLRTLFVEIEGVPERLELQVLSARPGLVRGRFERHVAARTGLQPLLSRHAAKAKQAAA